MNFFNLKWQSVKVSAEFNGKRVEFFRAYLQNGKPIYARHQQNIQSGQKAYSYDIEYSLCSKIWYSSLEELQRIEKKKGN